MCLLVNFVAIQGLANLKNFIYIMIIVVCSSCSVFHILIILRRWLLHWTWEDMSNDYSVTLLTNNRHPKSFKLEQVTGASLAGPPSPLEGLGQAQRPSAGGLASYSVNITPCFWLFPINKIKQR